MSEPVQIPAAVEKALEAKIESAVEKAVASRSTISSTAPVTPVYVTEPKKVDAKTALGLRIKAQWADSFGHMPGARVSNEYKAWLQNVTKAGVTLGTSGTGGSLVAPEYSSEIIEILRDQSVLMKAGVRGVSYNKQLNVGKLNGGVTAEFVAEGSGPTASTASTGSVILNGYKLMGTIDVSNDFLREGSASAAQVIGEDMVAALSTTADKELILGDGTANKPTGLINQLSAGQTFAITATPDITKIIADLDKTEQKVRASKIPFEGNRPGWIMDSATYMSLKSLRDAAGWVFRAQLDQGTLNGYPVYVTDSITASDLLVFGLFNQAYYGIAQDLVVDQDAPNFAADCTMTRGVLKVDLKVRHDTAFAVLTGVSAW